MLLGRKSEPEAVQPETCVPKTGQETSTHKPDEEVMESENKEKLLSWLTRCDAIAASDLFVQIGHPEDQVTLLKATLLRASAEGVNWRAIYRPIYERWHTERPHFPDLNTMATEIEQHYSGSKGT